MADPLGGSGARLPHDGQFQPGHKPPKGFQKGHKHAFKKGQSGNPGGRSRLYTEAVEEARSMAPGALKKMRELMNNAKVPAAVRLAAACAIWDRAWGKPVKMVAIQHNTASATYADQMARRVAIEEGEAHVNAK